MGKTINIYNNFDNSKLDKIMAQFEQYAVQLDRIETGYVSVLNALNELKGQIANMGLTAEQEDQILARITGIADNFENALKPPPPVEG